MMKKSKEMWKAFAQFVTKCQNLPEVNKADNFSKDPLDRGGHVYRPNESKAKREGAEGLVSSGSMTYAAVKSMLYARMDKNDPRVKAAMKYLMRNYVLTENPGMGAQGLFYYLHVMTKALDAFGADVLIGEGGKKHEWRKDVISEFLKIQQKNGSWANTHGRFFESDPSLATPYAIIALRVAAKKAVLKKK